MKVFTPYADITGDGAAHSLASLLSITSQPCVWYQVSFVANTSGNVARVGDSSISSSKGLPFGGSSSSGQFCPINSQSPIITYDLADVWVLIPSGDTVAVAYAI